MWKRHGTVNLWLAECHWTFLLHWIIQTFQLSRYFSVGLIYLFTFWSDVCNNFERKSWNGPFSLSVVCGDTMEPFLTSIIIQIFLTSFHMITSWENLFKHQDSSSALIISLILVTCMCFDTQIWWEKFDAGHGWGLTLSLPESVVEP